MGSGMQFSRALNHVEEYVFQLKKYSSNGKYPISDDSVTLRLLLENLDLCLMTGFNGKGNVIDKKLTYWDYICACFTASKLDHDGINFVKSIQSKTSLGCGRAFIRFCLTKQCLADTLQNCFMNQMVSREFYSEQSLIMQESSWSSLVTSLYELNKLNFDLNVECSENDTVCSEFTRELFIPQEGEKLTFRCLSSARCESTEHSQTDLKLDEQNAKLLQQNDSLLKEVEYLKKEKMVLQSDIQKLQVKCLSVQKQLKTKCRICFHKYVDVLESSGPKFTESSTVEGIVSNTCDNSAYCADSHNANYLNSLADLPQENIKNYVQKNVEHSVQESGMFSFTPKYNASAACSENTDSLCRNMCSSPNCIYFWRIFFEFKRLIIDIEDSVSKSDITAATSHISHLKNVAMNIEEAFECQPNKESLHLNFETFVENFIFYFKTFISKQESIINSVLEKLSSSILQNYNLYSSIITFKDLLRSYGFLKVSDFTGTEYNNSMPPFDFNSGGVSSPKNNFPDSVVYDPVFRVIFVSLIPLLNSMSKKLYDLFEKMTDLHFGLNSTLELNNNLISRVQDQEIHLKGVTKELEEAQRLVSVMKQQHKKLQSAEGILKYDLQEKRKLLTRLKQQLENTHEDFNLVKIKNSKSEAEWQDLRKEFVLRHKQTSEESGFEENDSAASNVECSSSISDEISENIVSNASETSYPDKIPKKRRLDLLEEQCQNLYSRLLQNSKRHVDIDRHLDVMCKRIEKSKTAETNVTSISSNSEIPPDSKNNDSDFSANDNFPDNLAPSPHSYSDIGSLNSECSLCLPGTSSDTSSFDGSCNSSKSDLNMSFSPLKFQGESDKFLIPEAVDILTDSESLQYNTQKNVLLTSSFKTVGISDDNEKNILYNVSFSQVDSLLIKKKDLEESLKVLDIDSELISDTNRYLESKEKNIISESEEKKWLLNKVQELEKSNLILSNELDAVTQQLIFSNTSKEHEVTALQLQLNSETVKYEKSLEEFREQSRGLESMKNKITKQEDFIQTLEESLAEIQLNLDNEKKQQWQESMCDLKKEKIKNELLKSQLKKLEEYNERGKQCAAAELTDLQNISRELKKRLVKLVKEKDLLWKRSNDLYHLQKIKMNDRWMKDSEVSSCLGCKNNFSFLLRKHHCRICGRIFCYSCSNNWLLTAASSKQLRTCNECFAQYLEIKSEVRRGSDVPHVDDSDDDEACDVSVSLNLTGSSSIISGTSASMNDSVISLPIMKQQYAVLSASAPNLSCAIRYVNDIGLEGTVKDKIFELSGHADGMDYELHNESNESEISSDDCTTTLEASVKGEELKDDQCSSDNIIKR